MSANNSASGYRDQEDARPYRRDERSYPSDSTRPVSRYYRNDSHPDGVSYTPVPRGGAMDRGNDYGRSLSDSPAQGNYTRRYSAPRDADDGYSREPRRSYPGRFSGVSSYDRSNYQSDDQPRRNDYDRNYRGTTYRPTGVRGGFAPDDRRGRYDSQRDGGYNSNSGAPSQGGYNNNYRYAERRERPLSGRGYGDQSNYRSNGSYRSRDSYDQYRQSDFNGAPQRRPVGGDYGDRSHQRFNGRGPRIPRDEPLSIAEELMQRYGRPGKAEVATPEIVDNSPEFVALCELSSAELVKKARDPQLDEVSREELVRALRHKITKSAIMYSEGTLELLADGYGFIRKASDFASCPDDVYVSPNQIRRFGLRSGMTVRGQIRPAKAMENNFALLRVTAINGLDPSDVGNRPKFLDLIASRMTDQLRFSASKSSRKTDATSVALRAIDKSAPIGFGQRALIVTPEEPESSSFMTKMVAATIANYPDAHVVLLLLGENATADYEEYRGPNCEIVSTNAGEDVIRTLHAAELAFEKAKRLVEFGKDVVVYCNSYTLLTQAWQTAISATEDAFIANFDSVPCTSPRNLLGLARKIDCGGSLTVVAATKAIDADVPADIAGIVDSAIFIDPESGAVDADRSYSRASSDFSASTERSSKK